MEKRLFIAIKYQPDEGFLSFYENIKKNLNPHATIKWVEPHQLHLTIIFLGNTDTTVIPFIDNALQIVKNECSPFVVNIEHLGIFSHHQKPSVLWLGIFPSIELQKLYNLTSQYLVQEFQKINSKTVIPIVEKNINFNPHLTLGRFKFLHNIRYIYDYIRNNANTFNSFWNISHLILYESILSPAGPTYKMINSYVLKT